MAEKIADTFTITIKGRPSAYTIEADGPKGVRVDPQPFIWSPSSEQKTTITALAKEKAHISSDAFQVLGKALYNAVFTPPIATAFGRAQASVGAGKGLRLRLRIGPLELASLPWETMHDGQSFLSARSNSPLVRALPGQAGIHPIKRLQVRGALRILFVGASPQGLPALDLEQIAAQLRQLLGEAIKKKRIVFDVLTNATLEELRGKLLQSYHILYFAAHGTTEGIYLDGGEGGERDPDSGKRLAGDPYLVTAQALAQQLEGKPTRLVFLAACKTGALFSETSGLLAGFSQELARPANLPAIVVMQYPISDIQANELTARFFESVAAYYPVDVALAEARKSLVRSGLAGRDVIAPVMYLQAEDGALFRQAWNWTAIAIGFAVGLIIVAALGLMMAVQAQQARELAWTEATGRAIAQTTAMARATGQAIAQSTGAAEATGRAIAQETAIAEATRRAISEATAGAERQRADQEESIARSRRLADLAQDNLERWPQRSLLLAAEGVSSTLTLDGIHVPAAEEALHQALGATGGIPLYRHELDVSAAVFGPDGHWLATSSLDGTIRLIDPKHPIDEPAVISEHRGSVWGMAISPDNRWLATGGADYVARLWDVARPTATPILLRGHSSVIRSLAFSSDSRWLATGSEDHTVRLWDVTNTAVEPIVLGGHNDAVVALAFSPDGRWLASGSWDESTRLWDMSRIGSTPIVLSEHSGWVTAVAFSPDGHWLATGSTDNTVRLWDVADPMAESIVMIQGEGSIYTVAFSPDGSWLAAGSINGPVLLWNMATITTRTEPFILRAHEDRVMVVAFSPDSHWLATGSQDNTVRLWHVSDPETKSVVLRGHESGISALAFSPDGRWLVTGGVRPENAVRLWEVGNSTANPIVLTKASTISFDPNGDLLTSSFGDVRLWSLDKSNVGSNIMLQDNTGTNALAFSSSGHWLVTTAGTKAAAVVNITDPTADVLTLEGFDNHITVASFSLDDHWLAISSQDASVWLWDLTDITAEPKVLRHHHSLIVYPVFSPDGRWLATGGWDATVRLWDLANLSADPVIPVDVDGSVGALSFSPDGNWLAVGSASGIVKLCKVNNLTEEPIVLEEHEGSIGALAFSPSGRWLATASGPPDNTMLLWDTSDLNASPVVLFRHEDRTLAMTFSPDERWLATRSEDKVVRVLKLQLSELIELACNTAGRNLTYEEWKQYFPGETYHPTCPNLSLPEE